MDMLDNLIQYAQISGCINVQCLFQGDWYVQHQSKQTQGMVHIVTEGESYIQIDNQSAKLLKKGDVIFFPRILGHVLSNQIQCNNTQHQPTQSIEGGFIQKQTGDIQHADFQLFCARFFYDAQAELIQNLPEMILLSLDDLTLSSLVNLLQQEAHQTQQGSSTIIDALSEVLLVYLIRGYLNQHQETPIIGVLNGWHNKRLRPLLNQILATPEKEWSMDNMAEIAHLSKAQLTRLFQAQIGITPYAFVHKVRVQKGAMLLKKTQETILAIALNCGFQTETHFGKAFKKTYGITPKVYRQNKNEPA